MANTATALLTLLNVKTDINRYTQEQIFWNSKYEANAAKLGKQVKYEENWYDAFNEAIDNTKNLDLNGIHINSGNKNEDLAAYYADRKVQKYDKELSIQLAAMDLDYDTRLTVLDSKLTSLRAQKEGIQQLVQTNARDTGIIGGNS